MFITSVRNSSSILGKILRPLPLIARRKLRVVTQARKAIKIKNRIFSKLMPVKLSSRTPFMDEFGAGQRTLIW